MSTPSRQLGNDGRPSHSRFRARTEREPRDGGARAPRRGRTRVALGLAAAGSFGLAGSPLIAASPAGAAGGTTNAAGRTVVELLGRRIVSISPDGRFVGYEDDGDGTSIDRQSNASVFLSSHGLPAFAWGGRVLVAGGGDYNGLLERKPLTNEQTVRKPGTWRCPSINSDGHFVAAIGGVAPPLSVLLFDRWSGAVRTLEASKSWGAGQPGCAQIASDGSVVVWDTTRKVLPADTDALSDVYVYDVARKTTKLVPTPTGRAAFVAGVRADGDVFAVATTGTSNATMTWRLVTTATNAGRDLVSAGSCTVDIWGRLRKGSLTADGKQLLLQCGMKLELVNTTTAARVTVRSGGVLDAAANADASVVVVGTAFPV